MSTEVIEFTVPAVPVPQPRPRATTIHGHARNYTPLTVGKGDERKPHPAVVFKSTAAMAFRSVYSGPPLTGPLRVDAVFVFPRPSRLVWKTRPMFREWHFSRPDRDNCDKTLLDGLRGVAFADDCQVCDGRLQKFYAAGDEQPHVEVRIERME